MTPVLFREYIDRPKFPMRLTSVMGSAYGWKKQILPYVSLRVRMTNLPHS